MIANAWPITRPWRPELRPRVSGPMLPRTANSANRSVPRRAACRGRHPGPAGAGRASCRFKDLVAAADIAEPRTVRGVECAARPDGVPREGLVARLCARCCAMSMDAEARARGSPADRAFPSRRRRAGSETRHPAARGDPARLSTRGYPARRLRRPPIALGEQMCGRFTVPLVLHACRPRAGGAPLHLLPG